MNKFTQISALLEKLCLASGVSGAENSATAVAAELLSGYVDNVSIDPLGSVIGKKEGSGTHILLDAHLDQIGLIVTAVDDDGFIKVSGVGGVDERVLSGAEVTVHGKEKLYGVLMSTPPHLLSAEEASKFRKIDEIAIDTGLNCEAAKANVSLGDRVTFNSEFKHLLGNRISCASIDDRAGVASVLRCLQILENKNHNCSLTVSFSVQEETGGSGARAAAFTSQPDEAIAVDVSFASAPGLSAEKYASLGKGPMIGYAPLLDYEMSNALKAVADKADIPYQIEVMGRRTGTNCDNIQTAGKGVKTALVSVPLRNMHTAVEVCDLEDIENTARLMAEYILERGGENA